MFEKTEQSNFSAPRISRFGVLFAAVLGLGGCSHGIQIADHADDYNVSVETAENRMFLRNIIRASKGYPLYFTRIESINSNLSSSVSLEPEFRIGADGATENPLNGLSLSTSSKPSVSHKILQSKEFFQGIYAPVSPGTLNLFLHQGWNPKTVLRVFVESVTVHEAGKKDQPLCRIENDPVDVRDLDAFDEFLEIATVNLTPSRQKILSPFGPNLEASTIANAESLKALKDSGLSLIPVNAEGQRIKPKNAAPKFYRLFAKSSRDEYEIDVENKVTGTELAALDNLQRTGQGVLAEKCFPETVKKFRQFTTNPKHPKAKNLFELAADIRLRSPQSMIYYLGQLARVDINPGSLPVEERADIIAADVNRRFTISSDQTAANAVSIQFNNARFSIAEDDFRTMGLLTLVRQVFMLNTSSDKPPSSPQSVRLFTD